MNYWKSTMGAVLLATTTAGAALAQAPAAPPKQNTPASVATEPAQTTASYGDWVLRCVRTGDSATAPRTCEVAQTLVLQGQQQPVAQLAIGRLDKADALRLTVVLPPAVSLAKVPQVTTGDADPRPLNLVWRRCLPGGCFADVSLSEDVLKMLRARAEPVRLTFRDAGEHDITWPFSLRGISQALDALAKETSAR
jgi:invasion protein IalB